MGGVLVMGKAGIYKEGSKKCVQKDEDISCQPQVFMQSNASPGRMTFNWPLANNRTLNGATLSRRLSRFRVHYAIASRMARRKEAEMWPDKT
jgi:hypothetical protein